MALGSCTKKGEETTKPTDGTTVAADPSGPVVLAPVDDPSQMLPRDTAVLIGAKSFARAAEVFERDRLVKTFGPQYTTLRSMMMGGLGADLLDPAEWTRIGLDPNGPLGLSVSSAVNSRIVAFATISDEVKLTEFMRATAGKGGVELVEQTYGSAKVLRPAGDNQGSVVMRDKIMALVLDDVSEGTSMAELLVTMDPNVSLSSQKRFRKATGGLRAADLTMYFDVEALVGQSVMEAEARASEPRSNWAQEELVEAQKRGASEEELARLTQQAEEVRRDQEKWRRREEGELALAELVSSGVEGVGLTVTVKRSGPIFDGRVVAAEDAFVRELLSNREGTPVLNRALNGAPLFCLSGRLEAGPAAELLEAIAGAEGQDMATMAAEIKAEMGLDLPADLKIAGASEMCITLDGDLDPTQVDPSKNIGLGAVVQMTDAAQPKYLLAKMAGANSGTGKRMKKQGAGYTLEVPDWRTMYLQPWDDRIVISSDPELATRLAAGKPGSMPSKVRPKGARGAMDLPGTAVSEAFDLSLGSLWLFAGRAEFSGPMMVAPGMTEEEMEKVPHSKKSKKAKKKLDKAVAEVEKLEREREAAEFKQIQKVTDPLGMIVGAVTEDSLGFTITGGQFLRVASLGQMVEVLLGASLMREPVLPADKQDALEAAWKKRGEASDAYSEARLEDAERFQKKNRKK